eukprot:CAMPEP_0115868552 /NCGR_PEP_ID=MMETSP0287-20121206/21353_1 /TAXON_ID=412157 /ORGANISM="Chrysochromulina rotalis, Strain UIO044" /LENGTH=61 /DNA_ID=CAMNT_0003323213 /DNA_START=357 /DNA_END=542 /DNA_ORIENTATION=+
MSPTLTIALTPHHHTSRSLWHSPHHTLTLTPIPTPTPTPAHVSVVGGSHTQMWGAVGMKNS